MFPRVNRRLIVRLLVVAACAYGFFGFVCLPMHIRGASMEPTYRDGGFTFVWRPMYWFREPRRHEVVLVRLAGPRVMYLKRVVALDGELVEFRSGTLYINGSPLVEPYVKLPCDWNQAPVRVRSGAVYIVGDNRSVPIEEHQFGQVDKKRIAGGMVW